MSFNPGTGKEYRVIKGFEGKDSREVYRAMNKENLLRRYHEREPSWDDAWGAHVKQDGRWWWVLYAPNGGTIGRPGPMGITAEVDCPPDKENAAPER
jgi:hypothetical protein